MLRRNLDISKNATKNHPLIEKLEELEDIRDALISLREAKHFGAMPLEEFKKDPSLRSG